MSIGKTYTAQMAGMDASIITIEVDLSNGLHAFSIVGLGDRAVEESKDRIAAAIKNSGYTSPKQKNQKVVISLSPANMRKEGPVFDLGMAITYLLAAGDINFDPENKLFLGELSLEGKMRPVNGILAMTQKAKKEGFKEIFIPAENELEAGLISDVRIYSADSLRQVIRHLSGIEMIIPRETLPGKSYANFKHEDKKEKCIDFEDILGQENAKRALKIVATGGHNIVMYGPPGTGKTMLAKALQSILPPLSYEESIEVTTIYSIAQNLNGTIVVRPPFRAPHHTSSYSSLVGGGNMMRPGEITLAHRGILFLDEFTEFDHRVIDALRQPLEDKTINIIRAKGSIQYPAHCILVAAMNPCPCGNLYNDDKIKKCICTDHEILRYKKKISGPIADRIDLWIPVLKVDPSVLRPGKKDAMHKNSESSAKVAEQIIKAREFKKSHKESMSEEALTTLTAFARKMSLSGRGYNRTISVARTIASLDHSKEIKKGHILEAFQYRQRDF